MGVQLDHFAVPSRDKNASAKLLAEILGVRWEGVVPSPRNLWPIKRTGTEPGATRKSTAGKKAGDVEGSAGATEVEKRGVVERGRPFPHL